MACEAFCIYLVFIGFAKRFLGRCWHWNCNVNSRTKWFRSIFQSAIYDFVLDLKLHARAWLSSERAGSFSNATKNKTRIVYQHQKSNWKIYYLRAAYYICSSLQLQTLGHSSSLGCHTSRPLNEVKKFPSHTLPL